MSSESGYFRLGLFILVGVGLLAAGIVVFGVTDFGRQSFIVETVTLESVQGLDPGAPVKFRGVQMGRVRKISLAVATYGEEVFTKNHQLGNAVILELALDPKAIPITTSATRVDRLQNAVDNGLRARIASSSLTGPPYVELVFIKDSKPIDLAWTPSHPYIPSAQGTITQFVEAAGEILESIRKANVGEILTHAGLFIDDARTTLKQIDIAEVRTHALALIDELRDTNKRLRTVLENPAIDQILKDGSETVASAKKTIQSPELQKFLADLPVISARLRTSSEHLDALLSDDKLNKSLENLGKASDSAASTLADLRRLIRNVNTMLNSQQQNLNSVVTNLRDTLENTAGITEEAKQNPARLLFGQPPRPINPGEKK